MQSISSNLADVQRDIRTCEKQYGRPLNSVSLLAVSKKQSIEKIQAAILAGQSDFGESYVQEALIKIEALAEYTINWHFIGPVQSNKTKKIAKHFAWVQSVSNPYIAQRLNDQRPSELPPLNICLQVNIGHELSKSGVEPQALAELAEYCRRLPRLRLRGLMAIPAPKNTFVEQVKDFHILNTLFKDLAKKYPDIDTLSMGMSNDLAAAISEGSTMVRVGTKIFGHR